LKFISTRAFSSCFEYRTDGNTSQIISEHGGINYNTSVTDGLYPYFCVNNSEETHTITASQYVEVRMVFGAERDERFDWTRFEVLPVPVQISTPTLLGWNVQVEAAGLESDPITLACQTGGVTIGAGRNSLNQRWTSVSGSNVKYIRRVSSDGGLNWNVLSGMVFTTPSMNGWFSFGASEEGTYQTEVMAFNDVNSNNLPDDGALNISDWSNNCPITYDATAPSITFSGFRNQSGSGYDNTQTIKSCGSINNSGYIAWEWLLNNVEQGPVTYTYLITAGPTAVGFSTTTPDTHIYGGIPMYGIYNVQVTGTDSAGNTSAPQTCSVNYKLPIVDLCSNIHGVQETVPPGYQRNQNGTCTLIKVGPPTNKDQCKNDGWKKFNNPTFKNQGQCVSYVESHHNNHEFHGFDWKMPFRWFR
jgi:hypothetical protein